MKNIIFVYSIENSDRIKNIINDFEIKYKPFQKIKLSNDCYYRCNNFTLQLFPIQKAVDIANLKFFIKKRKINKIYIDTDISKGKSNLQSFFNTKAKIIEVFLKERYQ